MSETIEKAPSEKTTRSVDALFEPYTFGKAALKNRVVMAPMTRNQSPGKAPGENVAAYYRRRAEGDVGLIITEGVSPDHKGSTGYPQIPFLDREEASKGWKRVVDEVHDAGGFIIPQLWSVGSIRQPGMEPVPEEPSYGPSAVLHPSFAEKGGEPAVEMTQDDIDEAIAAFAKAAAHSESIGFDGVEIHGAHSYLIDQFFWEATNKRTDKYGGKTLAERMAFAVELVEAVRAAVSPDYPVVFRFSQWKQGDYRHKMVKTPPRVRGLLDSACGSGRRLFSREYAAV